MKTRKIIGAVVVVLVIAAGLWWYTQSAPTPVIVTTAPLTTKIAIAPESQSPIDRGRVEAQSSPELENSPVSYTHLDVYKRQA